MPLGLYQKLMGEYNEHLKREKEKKRKIMEAKGLKYESSEDERLKR